jgi:PAS domain S-box-containing protein
MAEQKQALDACGGGAPDALGRARNHELEELRYQSIVETARDAIISIDRCGRVTDFNRAAERMFGYLASDVIGQDVAMLMPMPYREQHAGYIRAYQQTGEKKAIGRIRQVEALRANGDVFPIELAVSEARVGDEVLYTAIIRDLATLHRVLSLVQSERDFNEELIDAAPVIVLVLDRDGRIMRFNRYMEDLCGRSLADVRGADWLETFIPERDRVHVRALGEAVIAGQEVMGHTNAIVTAGGEERTVEWYTLPLKGAAQPAAILSVGQDVTDRRRAENEVRRLERVAQERVRLADVGGITAKLVHDLGNPLSGISMQAELLKRKAEREPHVPADQLVQAVDRMLAGVSRLRELVRGFMDFAREQRLELKEIDVRRFVDEVVEHWRPLASSRNVVLTGTVADSMPPLVGDETKLRRVLDNLVKNAIEAIQAPGGTVGVSANVGSDSVKFAIADSGSGIAPKMDVFKLFETTKMDGTGIGLAVSKEIVSAHGGGIRFASNSPCGTVFTVELPIKGPVPETTP